MSAGTPNEEAKRRGIQIGTVIRRWYAHDKAPIKGPVIGFDFEGDPVIEGFEFGANPTLYEVFREPAEAPTPPPPDLEPVRAAAFVALMLRIDIIDHNEEQIDRAFFRAGEIADRYLEAAARREARRAESDGAR